MGEPYNKELLFEKLNLMIDEDNFYFENNIALARKLFYKSSIDLLIYMYCKKNNISLIITDNFYDFSECEKIYLKNINKNKTKIIIASIAETKKALEEIINNT